MIKKLLFVIVLMLSMVQLKAKEIYVSPQGNDSNSGAKEAPFKTIQRAITSLSNQGTGTTIWLRGGFHQVDETINLGAQHGGSEGSPLVISSYPGEKAIVTGGVQISKGKFVKIGQQSYLERLHPNARGNVYAAQLNEAKYQGLFPEKDKYNKTAMVSWNGFVLNQAQFPNRGYAYISDILEKGPTTRWLQPGEEPEPYSETNPTGGKFKIMEQLDWSMMRAEFSTSRDMLINGYFSNDWFFQKERIGDISSDGTIQLLRYTRYGIEEHSGIPRRVNIIGALCQLDEPGEWYYDKKEKLFYIWPVKPFSDSSPITIAGSTKLFGSEGVDHVKFERIIFENFGDHGIRFMNSNHISVLGCEFRSANALAIRLYGTNNLVKSCDIHDLYQPVALGSSNSNNIKNLVDENNAIINCHIYNCSHTGYGTMGAGSVGGRFAHNLIHNMNGAISYGSNDCIVEYNEMYDMGYEMGDWNPIYRGADYSSYGNEVRFNFIHHLMETPKGYPVAAARNDDFGQGLKFHHNITYKTGRSVCEFTGAMNRMKDNIVMETQHLWWTVQVPYVELPKSEWLTKGDFLTTRYQTYLDNQDKIANGEMHANEKLNYLGRAEQIFGKEGWKNNQRWLEKYPFMPDIYNFDDIDRNPWMQSYDTIANNYASGVKNFPFHIHGYNKINNIDDLRLWMPKSGLFEMPHIINPEEIFVKPDSLNFNFKEGVTISGLEGFDFFDKVGLYVDEYRTEVPNKKAYRKAIADKYDGQRSAGGALNLELLNKRYDDPLYLSSKDVSIRKVKYKQDKFFKYNVSEDELRIFLSKPIGKAHVAIHSVNGQCVYKLKNENIPDAININKLNNGLYIISIVTEGLIQSEKFIK